jgi:hypothetical protein
LLAPVHQRISLLDGEFKIWKGECKSVNSPVHVRAAKGALTAYDKGNGVWPTMSVAERISYSCLLFGKLLTSACMSCPASDVLCRQF